MNKKCFLIKDVCDVQHPTFCYELHATLWLLSVLAADKFDSCASERQPDTSAALWPFSYQPLSLNDTRWFGLPHYKGSNKIIKWTTCCLTFYMRKRAFPSIGNGNNKNQTRTTFLSVFLFYPFVQLRSVAGGISMSPSHINGRKTNNPPYGEKRERVCGKPLKG